MDNNTNETYVGWQDQVNNRGTFDILKSCIGTVFLLCWSSVCPNVPRRNSGYFGVARQKLRLFILALIGPDFVLAVAAGQLHNAWRDKIEFHKLGHDNWNLRQCFFVNMGGLHFRFGNGESSPQDDGTSIPVNCTQLRYLLERKYIDRLPVLTLEDISERNKSDSLARTITVAQVLWFTVSTLARIEQKLHITTLELTTLSFVFIMVVCSLAWWRKPMDISHPMILKCETELSKVIDEAIDNPGFAFRNHGNTPISFIGRQEWFLSQIWSSYVNILRPIFRQKPASTKWPNSFASVEFPQMNFKWEAIPGFMVLSYSAIFMVAWNNYFPTNTERLLWRISSIICMVYGFLGCCIAVQTRHSASIDKWFRNIQRYMTCGCASRKGQAKDGKESSGWLGRRHWRMPTWVASVRNLSPDDDPALAMQLRVWIPATLLCIAYCFSRGFIIVEDFVSLRKQPNSKYKTVDWGQYSPIF